MTDKTLPFSEEFVNDIITKFPTPFYIYDAKAILDNALRLNQAFSWNGGFREYFAVKATPNPHIVKVLSDEANFGVDCSSVAELVIAECCGLAGEDIMLTSNDTPADEFSKAIELGAVLNLDDISHISMLENVGTLPELICFRYNPGPLRGGNSIIGKPEEAKYGLTRQQLFEAYRYVRDNGCARFGLHTMIASNELNVDYFIETARMLFQLVVELNKELGIRFEFVNLGGGIGIPYKPEDTAIDFDILSQGIRAEYENILVPAGVAPVKIFMECGRAITGPYGYLVTRAIHKKETYKHYIGVDACMSNLMRPALYGAYHHITVLGKEDAVSDRVYDVVGSLCENNDKFAIDRKLPEISSGDTLVIHDVGAHGHAMGFNYNGKLRSAELLMDEEKNVTLIRRAETLDDHFATLEF